MLRLASTILSFAEYKALNDKAVADGMYRCDRRILLPGMGWFNDWYLDVAQGNDFLSVHYNRDWRGKRPPIELVCPNGVTWCIDRKSSNGEGWKVVGDWPNLVVTPSIIAGDYHGWLGSNGQPPGQFSADIDGGRTYPIPNIGPDYGRK